MKKRIQALSLLLFSAFFFLATYDLPDWFPADIYLRLDRRSLGRQKRDRWLAISTMAWPRD
jgi:hypothetical protein